MRDNYILTAESVTEGHPDKLCDAIADSVLDACLKHDPAARVACEVMATAGKIIVAGEITAAELPDIPAIVCQTVRETGYGPDYEVEVITHDQSGDIAGAVAQEAQMGAGDQGIMYGYACSETAELLPLPVVLAHRLTLLLTNARKTGTIQGLGPDGKAQVSVEYQNGKPCRIAAVVVSCQHDADKDMLWEIRDRELYKKEQLAQAPEDVGGAVQAENLTERENPMSDVKQINADDLRHMEGQEGLILQGCGGDPQEWVDGINRELTEAGILLDGSKLENVVSFRHDGVTCLLFPFGDAELTIGKFAMWRIQTHDRYGGTWLSDYVPNRLGGFLQAEPQPQKPRMGLVGQDGNIYAVLGRASMLLKEAGMQDKIDEMFQRCAASGDYYKALNIISEYVETELSPKSEPQKSTKKKVRNTHER